MKVKIKKLRDNAIIPKYAHSTDAGLDLVATASVYDEERNVYIYGTGLAIEIPEGYVGLVFPRSSNYTQNLRLTNCVGVIDSGYRGEIKFIFDYPEKALTKDTPKIEDFNIWKIGERVGQLLIIPYPKIEFEEVEQLSNSDRGEGGFGSTGK